MRPIEILLVEDSPGDVRLTQEVLQEGKVMNNLHVVKNGEEALEFVHRKNGHGEAPRPDMILLDLNLPRKSGQDVLKEIKNDKDLRRIPVVVLTTSKNSEDVAAVYDLNANCYVVKPLDLDQFVQVIESIDNFWLSVVTLPAA